MQKPLMNIKSAVKKGLDALFGSPVPRVRRDLRQPPVVMSCAGPACSVPATCPRCPVYRMAKNQKSDVRGRRSEVNQQEAV